MLATINHGDVPSKQAADINKNFEELSGGGSGGLPVGVENQLLTWDENGSPVATVFTADMWSDFPDGAPKTGNWVPAAMFDNPEGTPTLGFVPVTVASSENSVVLRTAPNASQVGGGRIKATSATEADDVVNLTQLNTKPSIATTAPAAFAATAAVGTSATAARSDHVHAFPTQFATGRFISLTGGATGTSPAFNGANDAPITVTLVSPTATVRGGVLRTTAPTITITDPADDENIQAAFDSLIAALKLSGVLA